MSYAKTFSGQVDGLDAHIVDVEVDITRGLHSFTIVGLPDKAVEESRDRVSAALKNSGFTSPKQKNHKVVVSLAPANLKKEGPRFDVAIALAYLQAVDDVKFDPERKLFLGELSLDGVIRPIHGVLPIVRHAQREGFTEVFVPKENAPEAALIEGVSVYSPETLKELAEHLSEGSEIKLKAHPKTKIKAPGKEIHPIDFSDVRGQETAKRGLEIAAAGRHNIGMYGPPGTGKTMLARAFCSLLPELSFEEMLDVTGIHSVAGALKENIVIRAPFRNPHHTSSYVAIVGGGAIPRPGEVTLAHKGVLFLDEFPEFDRRVIESLRQPLEDRIVSISRAKASAVFPADFILIAAMNPCPCGFYGTEKECRCSAINLERYRKKMSGPIADRIDMWVSVDSVDHEKLSGEKKGEHSETIARRIKNARDKQQKRFTNTKINTNAQMGVKELEKLVEISDEVRKMLNDAAKQLELSPRAYHRTIKLARTIADLENSEALLTEHMLEALQFRTKIEH